MKLLIIHGQYSSSELSIRRKYVIESASSGTQIEFAEIKGDVFKYSQEDELFYNALGQVFLPSNLNDVGIKDSRCRRHRQAR